MNNGWRKALDLQAFEPVENLSKAQLYKAAQDAGAALDLRPAVRQLLNQLAGFFSEPIKGRALVWPSNDLLMQRTGLSERAVRYAVRTLIEAGLVKAKDSSNGKRFAVRSKSGQIVDAFGFDLAPVVARWDEFKLVIERKASQKAEERRLRQEVVIARRTIETALSEAPSDSEIAKELFSELVLRTPVRGAIPMEIVKAWRALQEDVLRIHEMTGNGGNSCRHIETNNETPDQSCSKGSDEMLGGILPAGEIETLLPAAAAWGEGQVRSSEDAIRLAHRVRGAIGAHRSVWDEAIGLIGAGCAALSVLLVAQRYEDQVRAGRSMIENPGGYLRAYVRQVASGKIKLAAEVARLRA